MKKSRFVVPLLILASLVSSTAWAHYLWLEAAAVTVNRQAKIDIDIRVGHDFSGTQLPNDLRLYETFSVFQDGQQTEVAGKRGSIPAGWVEDDGQALLVYYRSVPRRINMQRDAFISHLKEEGLEDALALYRQPDQPTEVTESFIHHAVLLVDGPTGYATATHPRNALLLLPKTDDAAQRNSEPTEFQLTYAGQPVVNAPVTLHCRDQSEADRREYTSAQGIVTFGQLCDGMSHLRSIHLRSLGGGRWQSDWSTLTLYHRQ